MSDAGQIRWARRVPPHKIRRLYLLDAKGIVDEELIDEVGYAMYARCESIRTVTEAHAGRAKCPSCGEIVRHHWKKDEPLDCECGWSVTWGEYLKSYQGKQLHGGAAFPAFVEFHEHWPDARAPRDKLLLIDKLIHALHVNMPRPEILFARPAAVNLIEGKMREISALLDELAYADLSTPGFSQTREKWQKTVDAARENWAQRQRDGK